MNQTRQPAGGRQAPPHVRASVVRVPQARAPRAPRKPQSPRKPRPPEWTLSSSVAVQQVTGPPESLQPPTTTESTPVAEVSEVTEVSEAPEVPAPVARGRRKRARVVAPAGPPPVGEFGS